MKKLYEGGKYLMKKRNDKGFTLVELIVVLVILAILAAILVPALLGYIDKAKEKQITTNAEAAYVAAQAVMTERYGKGNATQLATAQVSVTKTTTGDQVQTLAGIGASYKYKATYVDPSTKTASALKALSANARHNYYLIKTFEYTEGDRKAVWYRNGSEAVGSTATYGAGDSAEAGGWVVIGANDTAPASK